MQINHNGKVYKHKFDKQTLRDFNQKFNKPSLIKGLFLILAYIASIYITITVFFIFLNKTLILITLYPLLIIFVARQLRALENIIHFGSHYNLSRNKKLNDVIINVLCAYPLMQNVKNYRKSHLRHHNSYGGEDDPCKYRLELLKKFHINSFRTYLIFIFCNYPKYLKDYYLTVGSDKKVITIFLSYYALVTLVSGLIYSFTYSIFLLITSIISLFIALPLIRMIAEYGEHNYDGTYNVFKTTFNNLSLIDMLLFHPAGDAYHIVHHLHPAVPWWKQKKAHEFLKIYDDLYKTANSRNYFREKYTDLSNRSDGS